MLEYREIIQRLVLHEGLRLKPYKCTQGFWTIGVGRNIDTNPLSDKEKEKIPDVWAGITLDQAYFLLRNDIDRVIKECIKNIPFFENLDNERQYCLIDMCFQLGIGKLLKFKKMLLALGLGNYEEAKIQCLDSNYARQTPKRANRIAECMRTGYFIV